MVFSFRAKKDDRLLQGRSVSDVFGKWIQGETFLSETLQPFTKVRPLCFFDRDALETALSLFEDDTIRTIDAIYDVSGDLSRGFQSLLSPGLSWEKEGAIRLYGAEDLTAFEQTWHTEYERYCEFVFNKLLFLPLRIYEIRRKLQRGAWTNQFLGERVRLLKETKGCKELATLVGACRVPVRNAIVHGSASFGLSEVRYQDKKSTVVLDADEFGQAFDNLVDTCHGLAAAVICFLVRAESRGVVIDRSRLPFGMFYGAIGLAAYQPDWQVSTAIETVLADGTRQLIVYCETPTRLAWVHRRGTAQTAVEVHRLVGERYDRIAVYAECGERASPLRTFRSTDLEKARREGWDLLRVSRSAETDSCLFDAGPVEKWTHALKHAAKTLLVEHPLVQPIVAIRNESPGCSQSRAWITADVYWLRSEPPNRESLIEAAEMVISKLQHKRVDGVVLDTGRKKRPRVTHLEVRIHTEDARVRALQRRRNDHPALVAAAEWSRSGWSSAETKQLGDQVVAGKLKMRYL